MVYLQNRSQMVTYTYDESGLRTRKYNGSEYTYYDRDAAGNLVHETRNNGKDHLYYYYDANGSIGSISYNGVRYAFLKNLQGDVIAILDTNSNIVARYTYDAWGKVLSVTDANGNANTSSTFIGNVNPIRYRGYYYDKETGWYYLNSRYYDPEVKRFINADSEISGANDQITGKNLFAYCFNNPVMLTDETGSWPSLGQIFQAAVGVAVAAVAVAAVVTAGPVLAAAAAVGYTSGVIAAGATLATATVAAGCGGGMVAEAVTGVNPIKEAVGDEAFDVIRTVSTAGAIQGASNISSFVGPSVGSSSRPKVSSSGTPFKTGQRNGTVQVGVDPNTLKISRPILPAKMKAIKMEAQLNGGINRYVEVYSDGLIYDGNHRVAYAQQTGGAVDTIVIFQSR